MNKRERGRGEKENLYHEKQQHILIGAFQVPDDSLSDEIAELLYKSLVTYYV